MTKLQFQFDPDLDYQQQAVQSVVDVFAGLPRYEPDAALGHGIVPNLHPSKTINEGWQSCDFFVTAGDLDHRLWICLDAAIAPQTIAQLDLADKDLFICLDTALTDETKVRLSDTGAIHVI